MQDSRTVLRRIREYEEALQAACLALTRGRVATLRCDTFTALYDCLSSQPAFDAMARRLVHSHWAANAIIEGHARAGMRPCDVDELAHLRHEIHGQLRAVLTRPLR